MKYAKEVMGLMASYPGREFRMIQIVRHVVGGKPSTSEWERVRRGVRRVLSHLEEMEVIESKQSEIGSGSFSVYIWGKAGHELLQSGTRSGTIQASTGAPIGFEH